MAEEMNPRLQKLRRALREGGSRLPPDALWLARAVVGDSDDALSHEECQDYLPECADAEMEGENIAEKYPRVKQHLDLCDDCSEQYAELLELIRAERTGQIPVPFRDFVKQIAATILQTLAPSELPDLSNVADFFFQHVETLGPQLALQRGAAEPLPGSRSGEVSTAVSTLAVTWSAMHWLVDSLTPEQVDGLVTQNRLLARAEERALLAALELHVPTAIASNVAKQFAANIGADPKILRGLVEQKKR